MFRNVLRVVVSLGMAAAIFAIVPASPAGAQEAGEACTVEGVAGVIITVGRVAIPAGGELVDVVDVNVCVAAPVLEGSAFACPDADLVLITVEEITAGGLLVIRDVCVGVGTTFTEVDGDLLTVTLVSSNSPLPLSGGSGGDEGVSALGFVPVLVVLSLVAPAAFRRLARRRHRASTT